MSWVAICSYHQLEPERGTAALIGREQVALFRTYDGEVFALGNRDPIGGAYVLSRGIVGTRADRPIVTSPLFKQAYDLRTGECLDAPGVRVPTFPVRCEDGKVHVATAAVEAAAEAVSGGQDG